MTNGLRAGCGRSALGARGAKWFDAFEKRVFCASRRVLSWASTRITVRPGIGWSQREIAGRDPCRGIRSRARRGDWSIVLTPTRPVPREWFPALPASEVLCLASGGGRQGPLLAATGAEVTVRDVSPLQLAQDRAVAEREGLALRTVEGDMAQLSMFGDAAFDLIVHPCSNCFVPRIQPVWRESYSVLRPGGPLLAGFTKPVRYLFDQERADGGDLDVCHRIP